MNSVRPSSYDAVYNNASTTKLISLGEVHTIDDYEAAGAKCFDNKERNKEEVKEWANKTKSLALTSTWCHIAELPLKFLSYFSFQNDSESGWSKRFFALERFTKSLGLLFRYMIYNTKGDNLDAEKFAREKYGDKTTERIGNWNYHAQTKLKFLFPLIGLFNRNLANEMDWFLTDTLDSAWWRNMSFNSGFGPGIAQKMIGKILPINNNGESLQLTSIWKHLKSKTQEHYTDAKTAWQSYKKENKKEHLLSFAKEMDKLTSLLSPILVPVNFLGDTLRPLARRLELTGFLRNGLRVLSVADRGLFGINYIFRFLIPTRQLEKEQGIKNPLRASNIYIGSLIGDVLDIPLSMFEDKIKALNPIVNHSVEIFRMLKDSAFTIFWSQKRIYAADKALKKQS